MCGIIGYVGKRPCTRLLLDGLRRLEYRGYDSAGLAWREGHVVRCARTVGNLNSLEAALATNGRAGGVLATAAPAASVGIEHTRWATHGSVTEENAHPHEDASGRAQRAARSRRLSRGSRCGRSSCTWDGCQDCRWPWKAR
jgi:glucosamine--fructose-6-phosphate aminotransferase (isomerizing)